MTRLLVNDAGLAAEGEAVVARLVAAPTSALGAIRGLLLHGYGASLAKQLLLEARTISEAGAGPEGREGVAAFLARRKPEFR